MQTQDIQELTENADAHYRRRGIGHAKDVRRQGRDTTSHTPKNLAHAVGQLHPFVRLINVRVTLKEALKRTSKVEELKHQMTLRQE